MYAQFMLFADAGRRHPGAGDPPRPPVRLGALRACRRRRCCGRSTSRSCRSSSSRSASAGRSWQRRHDRASGAAIARGWLAARRSSSSCCPADPARSSDAVRRLRQPRRSGSCPGQAGAGSSTLGGTISIYAVGANLIWAVWGYHADGAMEQIAALWPLLMLLALRDARPRPQRPEPAAARARRRADGGAVRDRLDEARPVRAALLLRRGARRCCCSSPASSRRPRCAQAARRRSPAVRADGTMAVGLVDQQINGANPRLYDFQGAFDHGRRRTPSRATSSCTSRTTSPT